MDLGDVVVLACKNLLEAANRILRGDRRTGRPVKASPTLKGCEKNCSILRARDTVSLSSSDKLVHAENRDDILQVL